MKEMKFKYILPKEYTPNYANGAYGGINPKGEIVINFFVELSAVPQTQIYEIDKKGLLGKKLKTEPENNHDVILRQVNSGVIMNIDTAKKIRDWFDNQIKNFEKLNKELSEKHGKISS